MRLRFHIRPALHEDIPALKHIRDGVKENALVTLKIEHEDYVRAFTDEGRAWTCERTGTHEPVGFVCARPGHKDIWALFVRGDVESHGIGHALMDIAEQWMFAHEPRIDEMHLSTEAGTRAERLYTRRGWQRQGMVRGEVVFTLPRRVSLREANVEDAAALGALHVAAWQWAYRGLVDQHYLDALDPLARGERWRELLITRLSDDERTWLAFDGAELVGFCDAHLGEREVRALYVAQRMAGTSAGARLLRRALDAMERRAPAAPISVWVLAANTRARRFYEKHGFRPDGATKEDARPDRPKLFDVRYVRRR